MSQIAHASLCEMAQRGLNKARKQAYLIPLMMARILHHDTLLREGQNAGLPSS